MYLDHWQLKENPFDSILDFRFLYMSASQEECLARLSYTVSYKKGGAVLLGPAGGGKTTIRELLIRKIKEGRRGKRHFCSIVHPLLTIPEIVQDCLAQLGVPEAPASKPQLLRLFGNTLLQLAEKGEEAILIIDDAHLMSLDSLNELKLLLNLHDYNQRLLFTTILIGESEAGPTPGIAAKLAQVPGLKQRLNLVVPMPQLTRDELAHYIQHRVGVAGGKKPLFTQDAVEAVFRYSKGNPRETNNLCDLALLIGYGEKAATVDGGLIKRVVHDITAKAKHGAPHHAHR